MKIVIAPDKFKGSLTAAEAARAISRGAHSAAPDAQCSLCPMADGGEGTVDVFLERGAARKVARVRGPLGAPADAVFALDNDSAILEMASASGLGLLERSQYDPTHTDTFGTGQLRDAALHAGAQRLIIGIGGSATNDAGTGMLRALGVRFLDKRGAEIDGGILDYERLETIEPRGIDERIAGIAIEVAVDVDNPLCGPNGATARLRHRRARRPTRSSDWTTCWVTLPTSRIVRSPKITAARWGRAPPGVWALRSSRSSVQECSLGCSSSRVNVACRSFYRARRFA
ncbi:MAG: glycerate kinase [Candidatus Cybelea sp.]